MEGRDSSGQVERELSFIAPLESSDGEDVALRKRADRMKDVPTKSTNVKNNEDPQRHSTLHHLSIFFLFFFVVLVFLLFVYSTKFQEKGYKISDAAVSRGNNIE